MSDVRHDALRGLMERERPRLIRFFLYRGVGDGVEDLVQDTLLEAWRNRHKLRTETIAPGWLFAIAQNVLRRWWQQRQLLRARQGELNGEGWLPDTLAENLERHELAGLIDRALDQVPESARTTLVGHYLEEKPLAELAVRLGSTEGAIATRLFRARKSLLHAVLEHHYAEAVAYGLVRGEALWEDTRLWCANCGKHRLRGRLPQTEGTVFELRCPACHGDCPCTEFRKADLALPQWQRLVGESVGFRRILKRLDRENFRLYRSWLDTGVVPCATCGGRCTLERSSPREFIPTLSDRYGFHACCRRCQRMLAGETLGRMLMGLPELEAFWSRHPRMRRQPERDIVYDGTEAVQVIYESVTSSETLEVVCRKSDLSVLSLR